ncbi:two-component system response regulator [Idiomarina tyrosinivorans]|uniref:Two-component system response regulator n=1 Tax=Idiomarina tyrosinivorans TaxID=1445662 RepID=A0A432ZLT0_9GAMM|nr:response regulator [Idiomarina tyrosinivorans]RUO78874.1 two-component system response regulator [Idiomarina tyrosinivorans]
MPEQQASILVADDDLISSEVTKAMLAIYPVNVITVESGQAAIQQAIALRPQLILLDYEMPDINGADVCRELRRSDACQSTPVVAITSHHSATEMEDCRAAGMDATLHKPVNPDALDEILRRYLFNDASS